jgi:hypothetical protein
MQKIQNFCENNKKQGRLKIIIIQQQYGLSEFFGSTMDKTKQKINHLLFVLQKSPQVHLQIVSVDLNLLQSKFAERSEADTLEEGLEEK